MISAAAGMALSGKIPFLCSFACFLTGRFDIIRVSVGYTEANVRLVGTHSGIGIGEDGYSQIIERRVVFLVKTGEASVTALDPTCTHLGCRVSWDAEARELRCPCHGGVYDHLGQVKSGPPPAPLPKLSTKIDGDKVFIQV